MPDGQKVCQLLKMAVLIWSSSNALKTNCSKFRIYSYVSWFVLAVPILLTHRILLWMTYLTSDSYIVTLVRYLLNDVIEQWIKTVGILRGNARMGNWQSSKQEYVTIIKQTMIKRW